MAWFQPVTSIFESKCSWLSFLTDSDTRRQYEVVEALTQSYHKKYLECVQWKKKLLIPYNLEVTSISTMFNLKTRNTDGKIQQVLSDTDIFGSSSDTIIVSGKPQFGKTTLCDMLSYHWSLATTSMSNFLLCISYPLTDLDVEANLADLIVTFSTMMLAQKAFTEGEISSAFAGISGRILLVLDGYDELSCRSRERVRHFLKNKSVFQNSTVVLTTRPVSDYSFVEDSYKVINIEGFTYEYLLSVFKSTTISETRVDCFKNCFGRDFKLDYLCDLSPFFTSCVWLLVRDFYVTPTSTPKLEVLFGHVTEVLARYFHQGYPVGDVFLKLGELFYEALVQGNVSFEETLIRKVLPNCFDFVLECKFFFKERNGVFTVSSKVLMVYLATQYLKHLWTLAHEEEKKIQFLRDIFCVGTCTGDYVYGKGESRSLYYVGLVPEIVLKFGKRRSLQQATFEMYYDVEETETTDAFDSVNLLLRVSDDHLSRFSFDILARNDKDMLQTYDCVLKDLENNDCSVEYSFYKNSFEGKTFLKVLLSDPDEVVLRAVCRSNSDRKMDRMIIDLSFSQVDDLFGLMSTMLSVSLKGIRVTEGWKYYSFQEFVFSLVWSIVEMKPMHHVSVQCLDDVKSGVDLEKDNITFGIMKPDGASQHQVEVFDRSLREIKVYQGLNFWKSKKDVMSFLLDRYGDERTQIICIDILL